MQSEVPTGQFLGTHSAMWICPIELDTYRTQRYSTVCRTGSPAMLLVEIEVWMNNVRQSICVKVNKVTLHLQCIVLVSFLLQTARHDFLLKSCYQHRTALCQYSHHFLRTYSRRFLSWISSSSRRHAASSFRG